MNRLGIAIVAILVLASSAGEVRFYALEEDGFICDTDIEPFVPVEIYLIIRWSPYSWNEFPEGVIGARFSVSNLPENLGYPTGWIIESWYSDHYYGDLETEFTLLFDESQGAQSRYVVCGSLEFLMFDPLWIGEDYVFSIVAGDDCHCIVIFDHEGHEHDAYGSGFAFNCTPDPCEWGSYEVCWPPTVPTAASSWSTVKALF